MSGDKPKGAVEVIHPPNKIKARVGPAGKGMDPNLLARAEAADEALATSAASEATSCRRDNLRDSNCSTRLSIVVLIFTPL